MKKERLPFKQIFSTWPMRNYYLIVLFVTLTPQGSCAQNFPLNEEGMISFFEVVEADSLKKPDLLRNADKWLSQLRSEQLTEVLEDSSRGTLSAKSSFLMYAQSGILKKVSGKISYSISIDVKSGKYRYSFNDFVFHYYKVDRTYNIVDNGKTKKLEDTHAAGWQELWSQHRAYTYQRMSKNIELLKQIMRERPVVVTIEKNSAKKVEW